MRYLLIILTLLATGCAPPLTGLAAQRAKIRAIKIGVRVIKVTKLTDREFKLLVDKLTVNVNVNINQPTPNPLTPHNTRDAQEFQRLINGYRQSLGLGLLYFDEQLAAEAEENNRRGGHHVYMGSAHGQCWASVTDMARAFEMWQHSPGHDRLMRGRGFTSFGIASGPGNHCTLNLK